MKNTPGKVALSMKLECLWEDGLLEDNGGRVQGGLDMVNTAFIS